MKRFLLLFLAASITIAGCKKNDDNPPSNELITKLTTNINVMHNAGIVYNNEFQQSGDSLTAANAMREWLVGQADVGGGWVHNREFFEVEFSNGLKSPINIIPVRQNGEHLRRGGGMDTGLASYRFASTQSKEIKNKKALVLIPYTEVFGYGTSGINNIRNALEANNSGIEVDIETDGQVELNDLNRLGDYGLIILDVHGVKHGFFLEFVTENIGTEDLLSAEDIINTVINDHDIPADKLENGQIEIGLHVNLHSDGSVYFRYTILVTEEYIRQLNVDLTDAVLMGNHCFSGHTADGPTENNLPEAWRSKGLATYYGYAGTDGVSAPVDNIFCRDMELNLINGLISDGDSTGVAHLDPAGEEHFELLPDGFGRDRAAMLAQIVETPSGWELYFRQFFDEDYEYESCQDTIVDSRDGQVYKTVCIGNQVWMAENLNYAGAGVCYNNAASNCETYGRLYSWQEAVGQSICPTNWHIPSDAEVQELFDAVGGDNIAGESLKADTIWFGAGSFDDEYGFSALPSGHWNNEDNAFELLGERGEYWSSSIVEYSGEDYYRMFYFQNGPSGRIYGGGNGTDQMYKFACRCVKD
ncbi:MAG: fibrobacter succinogenes major paralogous domain-containing protein [Flavobacteriales bacterium]